MNKKYFALVVGIIIVAALIQVYKASTIQTITYESRTYHRSQSEPLAREKIVAQYGGLAKTTTRIWGSYVWVPTNIDARATPTSLFLSNGDGTLSEFELSGGP